MPSSSRLPNPPRQDVKQFRSVLKQIPAEIYAIVSDLPLEEQEVLAYMITTPYLETPTGFGTIFSNSNKKLSSRNTAKRHKPPVFNCLCFDCYFTYWFCWHSSTNHELIHQAIEAYEDHIEICEQVKKNDRGKRRNKRLLRGENGGHEPPRQMPLLEDVLPRSNGIVRAVVDERMDGGYLQAAALGIRNDHKGLVRKVLPDVVGLLNSRLWKLWNPSM